MKKVKVKFYFYRLFVKFHMLVFEVT